MGKALKRAKPFSGEMVRLYEEGKNDPGKDARRALALVFDRTESYIEFGDATTAAKQSAKDPFYEGPTDAKEELALYLFHNLIDQQQREIIRELRAFFAANQAIRKQMGGVLLRGVSDADVARAFGEAPHVRRPAKKARAKDQRPPDAPLDDYVED